MAIKEALDDLIEQARLVGKHKTKKEAVTTALEEYVRRQNQLRILEAFGCFDLITATTTKLNGAEAGVFHRLK